MTGDVLSKIILEITLSICGIIALIAILRNINLWYWKIDKRLEEQEKQTLEQKEQTRILTLILLYIENDKSEKEKAEITKKYYEIEKLKEDT